MTGKEDKSPGHADGGAWHLVESLQWTFVPFVPGPELDSECRHTPDGALNLGSSLWSGHEQGIS